MAEARIGGQQVRPIEVERRVADNWALTDAYPAAINRISWGAIFAGAVVALVAQLLFSLLGLAIGLTLVEPITGDTAWEGIGIAAGVWWIVSALVSLFLGGWTAGRLAGMPTRVDAMLHGVVTWAVVTFVAFYLMITGVGMALGGALGVVQQGIQAVGGGVGAAAPVAADWLSEQEGATLQQIQQNAGAFLQNADAEVARDMSAALQGWLQEGNQADRQQVIAILDEQTGMSRAEATNLANQFEQQYRQVSQMIQGAAGAVGQRAPAIAEQAEDAIAIGAWWAFLAMVVGVITAAAGSAVAAPRDLPASPDVRRE